MFNKYKIIVLFFLFSAGVLFIGWSYSGHSTINGNAGYFLIPEIPLKYNGLMEYIKNHASDADNRKSSDPEEDTRHFIDIDKYGEFIQYGKIIQDYSVNINLYGQTWVKSTGVLPWAIVSSFDSLTVCFKRNDITKINVLCADLGHYIGDMHNPFHLTKNYNGQYSGQSGIHSRYESTLINKYLSEIIYSGNYSDYIIPDISQYTFDRIYLNYKKTDSLLKADKDSYSNAGNKYDDYYYLYFWTRTKDITIPLMKNASKMLAEMILNAYYRAGLYQVSGIVSPNANNTNLKMFSLSQNYPNPFNTSTEIEFNLSTPGTVKIAIYNSIGKTIAVFENYYHKSGIYKIQYNANGLSSGVYYCRAIVGRNSESRKMILLK